APAPASSRVFGAVAQDADFGLVNELAVLRIVLSDLVVVRDVEDDLLRRIGPRLGALVPAAGLEHCPLLLLFDLRRDLVARDQLGSLLADRVAPPGVLVVLFEPEAVGVVELLAGL